MLKTLKYIICIMFSSAALFSTATIYGKGVILYVTNKCGPNQFLFVAIERKKHPCGHHRWAAWQDLTQTKLLHLGQSIYGKAVISQFCGKEHVCVLSILKYIKHNLKFLKMFLFINLKFLDAAIAV